MAQHYPQDSNVQNQEWSKGLCSCGPCDTCLLGTFLPCILLGRTSYRMQNPSTQAVRSFNNDCMIFCAIQCVTGCGWVYTTMKRGEVRQQFGIQGSIMRDCCTSYWCGCCALIQLEEEVKARHSQVPITQGYKSQTDGMQMPEGGSPSQPATSGLSR
ncbi:PLAC8 family-domain-containing protein [Dactylonectria estremocensis]|uniref:PLAC8 family-domain-containing protein n=1 Tax=Dactylonectria estremocensis TaxID=1079267 RepID=A0A9P9D130_9HYPO|nr:PLAC8 family-domain-containing protein [Dactylonectria estremocensis]KAH7111966.1 PLAC8 family-domain-containing protein [Dactylonectria estremocensis]